MKQRKLAGAAYFAHLLKQEGLGVDTPMMIGDQPVLSLSEVEEPGYAISREAFAVRISAAAEPLDEWARIRAGRQERRAARAQQKEIGRAKLKERLQRAHFKAAIELEAARRHHEVTKHDLTRYMRGEVERKPLPEPLRGHPDNLRSSKQWIERHYPLRQQA